MNVEVITVMQQTVKDRAQVGDWIEARGLYGQPPRRGEVVEVLGVDRHMRYRVRWDEQHESIVYPADGVLIIPRTRQKPS